jgi:ribonuclease D
MGDDTLAALARLEPRHIHDLDSVRGLSRSIIARYGMQLLQAVAQGLNAKPPTRPERAPRMDTITQARYDALRNWRKARAAERGVESDVIIPRESVMAMARQAPHTFDDLAHVPGLGPWRRARYGEEILRTLAGIGTEEQP